ncbi:putative late blight resistance protein homolog R1A-3 [Coffea eugenioides]|uniref:putative late blight resistance protein homolog R1A-3 n=1 Tax=Coffea eugenioides TaxID=49369 RepID=UPI000F611E5C|nr:putative late blight resistance protein homolog R1A-3 [Coffea eugenioides]
MTYLTYCSIASVLDNLEKLFGRLTKFEDLYADFAEIYDEELKVVMILKLELKLVRTFLLCARKWSFDGWKHGSLEAFLSSLERELIVLNNYEAFYALTEDDLPYEYDMIEDLEVLSKFRAILRTFEVEFSELYMSLLDFVLLSNSSMVDDVLLEFIDSLLENLGDVLGPKEPLKEKLNFLKDLILFVTWEGVEHSLWKDLLARFQFVAVQAAHLSYMCWFDSYDEVFIEIQFLISELLQMIRPVNPEFSKTCARVLRAAKLTGLLHSLDFETDMGIVGNFADSLLDMLWEVLNCGTSFAVAKRDQMQMLNDGLRFLRAILKMQQEKFNLLHQKMKDLVGASVNDAGILIYSLFTKRIEGDLLKDLDLAFLDFLEKIKLIKIVTSTFDSPGTNGLGFIKFLLDNLTELARLDLVAHSRDQIQIVQKDFVILGSVFEKIDEQRNKNEKLTALWSHAIEVANKVMLLISSFDLSPLSFDSISEELLQIKTQAKEIGDMYGSEAKKVAKTSNYGSLQARIPRLNHVVVGFDDETKRIINQVKYGSQKLDVVSIVGMAGLGKTTLAKRVYNNRSIRNNFHIWAWCNVSQVYRKKDLLLEILGCIYPENSKQYSEMEADDLTLKLYQSLKLNKYFIVLDDVWDIKAWHGLKESFPDDSNKSRILITSRLYEVASQVKQHSEPNHLRHFTDDESWELLQKMLFPNESCPLTVATVGMQIAKSCCGLPLAVVIIAGILATTEQDGWKEYAERLSTRILSASDQCKHMLELSYRHIPDYLKPCLLYFVAFLQGLEIPMQKLIWLWIAEGLVQQVEHKELEEVAEGYINDLIGRSLVMVAKKTSIGGIKTCRVHDLIHEFLATKGRVENFLQLLHGYDGLYTFCESYNTRRLCIYSKQEYFEKSRLFCPQIRGLMFFPHGEVYPIQPCDSFFIFRICKLLKVLDLGEVVFGEHFPAEIEMLVELRYLAIRGKMQSIPSSIAKLYNLKIFLVKGFKVTIMLPDTIWNMTNLRHISVNWSMGKVSLVNGILENNSVLYNLSSISNILLYHGQSMEKILMKFPNIRKLKFHLFVSKDCVPYCSRIVKMDHLSRLESLSVTLMWAQKCRLQFHFPSSLRKLHLFFFSWNMISRIWELPNLEVLTLSSDSADKERTWEIPVEVEFPNLRILHLRSLGITRWTGSGDHFPRLQKLILQSCGMKEIPSCLGSTSTLEKIEVCGCSPSVERLVREIQEEQDTEDLQIDILTS